MLHFTSLHLCRQSSASAWNQCVHFERPWICRSEHYHLQLSSGRPLQNHAGVQDILGQLTPTLCWEASGQASSYKSWFCSLSHSDNLWLFRPARVLSVYVLFSWQWMWCSDRATSLPADRLLANVKSVSDWNISVSLLKGYKVLVHFHHSTIWR